MGSFDIISFLYAVLGTLGIIGIGISLGQLSLLIFSIALLMTVSALVLGFKRKNSRQEKENISST